MGKRSRASSSATHSRHADATIRPSERRLNLVLPKRPRKRSAVASGTAPSEVCGCTIAIGDYWIDLILLGDGHVGHRAVDFSEHTSHSEDEDEGDDSGGEHDADGIAQAAATWRRDPNSCAGEAVQLPEGMHDHQVLVTDARLIVAIVCDTFAYQSLYELTSWEDEQLLALVAEQWMGGGELIVESMILGLLDVDDNGRLTSFEKARGPGDYGKWSAFVERGASILALDEARVRECDDQAEYVEPEQWPVVYTRSS